MFVLRLSVTIELVRNVRFLNSPKVLLIDETGKNLGELESISALRKAREAGLDLILINRATVPPVCRIGNLGKLKYEATKRQKANRKREQETKTLKIRPDTQTHDLDIDVRKAKEFLLRGDKVKIECRFRNREIEHPHLGHAKIEYIITQLEGVGKVEKNCELIMRSMVAIIAPKS